MLEEVKVTKLPLSLTGSNFTKSTQILGPRKPPKPMRQSRKGLSKAEYRKISQQAVLEDVSNQIQYLLPGVEYTLKDICTARFWANFPPGTHRGQGLYISTLVKKGLFPLVACGRNSSKSKLYRLK